MTVLASPGGLARVTAPRAPSVSPARRGSDDHGRRRPAMSLAPNERRALAGIENALCSSDPRLAAMLATFTLPIILRVIVRVTRLLRWRRRGRRFLWATAGLAAVGAVVLIWLAAG